MRALALWVTLAILALPGAALADRAPVRLAPGALPAQNDGLSLTRSPLTLASGSLRVNTWLSYAHRPLVLSNERGGYSFDFVRSRVATDYALALGVVDRLELNLGLPIVIYQWGEPVGPLIDRANARPMGFGNLELGYKTTWVKPQDLGGASVGSLGLVRLPTGSSDALLSNDDVEGELWLLSSVSLLALELKLNLGAHLVAAENRFLMEDYGDEFLARFGVELRPVFLGWDRQNRTRLGLEVAAALPLEGRASGASGSHLRLGATRHLEALALNGGLQFALDGRAGNPTFMALIGLGWSSEN